MIQLAPLCGVEGMPQVLVPDLHFPDHTDVPTWVTCLDLLLVVVRALGI